MATQEGTLHLRASRALGVGQKYREEFQGPDKDVLDGSTAQAKASASSNWEARNGFPPALFLVKYFLSH